MRLQLIPHSEPVDLSLCRGEDDDAEQIEFMDGCAEVIRNCIEDEGIHASLPFEWVEDDGCGGPPVSDVSTIYINLPFGDVNGNYFAFSFTELVDQYLDESGLCHSFCEISEPELANAALFRDMLESTAKKIGNFIEGHRNKVDPALMAGTKSENLSDSRRSVRRKS